MSTPNSFWINLLENLKTLYVTQLTAWCGPLMPYRAGKPPKIRVGANSEASMRQVPPWCLIDRTGQDYIRILSDCCKDYFTRHLRVSDV